MKKLYDLVELISNTEEAVVLKVIPGHEVDLICLGCFNGDETMLRLTKGKDQTCTVWTKNSHYSWYWGDSGFTLVSDDMTKKGRLIQHCIEDDFDILVHGDKKSILRDINHHSNQHKLVMWENGMGCACRKDDEFYRYFKSLAAAVQHFKDCNYVVEFKGSRIAEATGFKLYDYVILKY